jgi:hypothetical protein
MNIDEQNRAYYESLEQDMEKEMLKEIEEIDRQTKLAEQSRQLELEKKLQLELEIKKQLNLELEMKQNQPTKDELRQRRLKFYENNRYWVYYI